MYYLNLYLYLSFIGLCCLLSIAVYFNKNQPKEFKLFFPFLLSTFITSIIAYELAKSNGNNHALFNYYSVFSFLFYFFILHELLYNQIKKKILKCAMVLYPALEILNILFFQDVNMFHSFTYSIGACIIICFAVFCLQEIFIDKALTVIPHKAPAFWVCTGLLFHYSITFVYFSSLHIWKMYSQDFINLMSLIFTISNCIFYSLITISFFCNWKPFSRHNRRLSM